MADSFIRKTSMCPRCRLYTDHKLISGLFICNECGSKTEDIDPSNWAIMKELKDIKAMLREIAPFLDGDE